MEIGKDEMSGHGFRAMARNVLDEKLHVRPDFIDPQLAHAVRDPNGEHMHMEVTRDSTSLTFGKNRNQQVRPRI